MEVDVIDFNALAFAPDSRTFITGENIPALWEIGGKEPLHQFEDLYPLAGTIVEADAVDISPDGKWIAIAGGDGKIHLFDFTDQGVETDDRGRTDRNRFRRLFQRRSDAHPHQVMTDDQNLGNRFRRTGGGDQYSKSPSRFSRISLPMEKLSSLSGMTWSSGV